MVLITGASSGIGAATARACGAAGMRVVLAARREELLRSVASQVDAAGGEAFVVPTDVRVPDQTEALVAAATERFGKVDVLVANAGMGCPWPVVVATDAQIAEVVGVNLLGVMRCVRAVLPGMVAQGSGHILTVSSVVVGLGWPNDAIYAATKAGVHRFAMGLRREVRPHGLYVTDVIPGVIDTPLTAGLRGLPKADAADVGRAMAGVIARPRPVLIVPGWYRLLLGLNRVLPGIVDRVIAARSV